jgi:hypothetical protein
MQIVLLFELAIVSVLFLFSVVRYFHIGFSYSETRHVYRSTPRAFIQEQSWWFAELVVVLVRLRRPVRCSVCAQPDLVARQLIALDVVLALAGAETLRWSRVLRPAVFIFRSPFLHTLVSNMLRTVGRVLEISFILLVIIFVFALIGAELFRGLYPVGKPSDSFDTPLSGMLTLFILLTPENYPTVMCAAGSRA